MDNLWKFMFKNFVAIDVILFAVDSVQYLFTIIVQDFVLQYTTFFEIIIFDNFREFSGEKYRVYWD